MYERSLYEYDPVPTPLKEGDPFYDYEIKGWRLGPRIYKILGFSAAVNILALLVVAQTSLLTLKGCDSPLVGSMCQVLDTVYVGTMLWGTEREYVDQAYDKTDLGDVEITYVDVTGAPPPLEYPSGYFQIANPEKFADPMLAGLDFPSDVGTIPGIPPGIPMAPPSGGNNLFDTTPVYPKSNPNPIAGDLPPPGGGSSTQRTKKRRGGGQLPDENGGDPVDPGAVAEVKPSPSPSVEPTDPLKAVVINREPLKVFGRDIAQKIEKNELNLAANFKVEAEGVLTPEGKLDTSIDKKTKQKKSRITLAQGDESMIKAATEAIAAVGDSQWLGYLSSQKIEKIKFLFGQTDDQLIVTIFADPPKGKSAEAIASGLNFYIAAGLSLDLGEDERKLLQAAKVTAQDKQLVLLFTLPKGEAHEMIMRNIQKAKEEAPAATGPGTVPQPSPQNQTR